MYHTNAKCLQGKLGWLGQVYMGTLYFPWNFSVNLKLLKKLSFNVKKSIDLGEKTTAIHKSDIELLFIIY